MLFSDDDLRFTREDAARALDVPIEAIDALVEHGVLPRALDARAIEAFLRDSLIRLYHATATATAPAAAKSEPQNVLRSMPEYEAESRDRRKATNQRAAPRYQPARQLTGTFRDVHFSVQQISASGVRIRHEETLRPNDDQRVTIALPGGGTAVFRARVVWSSIGSSYCVSGLRVTANGEQLAKTVDALKRMKLLKAEDSADGRRKGRAALAGISDDDVASIIRAHRILNTDAEGVFDYLDGRVGIDSIRKVIAWLRQTRSAEAV